MIMRLFILLLLLTIISCGPKKETITDPKLIEYSLVNSFPHDKKAFIQGFVIHEGQLYESTGQDSSWIGIVNIKTGIADKKVFLDNKYFGEGITILNNKIYQLTWENKKGFIYDLKSFKKVSEFSYNTQGWGLTHDSSNLIMSDGTSRLYLLDTLTLKPTKTLNVTYNGKPVNALNELEFINGYVYANIWQTNLIAKIDLKTGDVQGFLDLSKLAQQAKLINPNADVLNGLAWHKGTNSLLVTGKYWPFIYVLKLKETL